MEEGLSSSRSQSHPQHSREDGDEVSSPRSHQSQPQVAQRFPQAWPLFLPHQQHSADVQGRCPERENNLPAFPMKKKAQERTGHAVASSNLSSNSSSMYTSSACSSSTLYTTTTSSSCRESNCSSPLSSESSLDQEELEETIARAQHRPQSYALSPSLQSLYQYQYQRHPSSPASPASSSLMGGKSPLFSLGPDMMAHVLTFLKPQECLKVLTMPLNREWRDSYTSHQDLWRVLCIMEPFKAILNPLADDDDDDEDDDDSFCSLSGEDDEPSANELFGKYRLMYTSFVRCERYLTRIQEHKQNGRPPSVISYQSAGFPKFGAKKSLKKFLARTGGLVSSEGPVLNSTPHNLQLSNHPVGVADTDSASVSSTYSSESFSSPPAAGPLVSDEAASNEDGRESSSIDQKRSASTNEDTKPPAKKVKYAPSSITARLLGPTKDGKPGHVELPRSCAVYSIVNWMVAFPDVEGIQSMCIATLPTLLEDENQRSTAQQTGLTNVVLQAMVRFPDNVRLHTASFHTMVLLARPMGGREGMLFDNSMTEPHQLGLLGGNSSVSSVESSSSRPGQPRQTRVGRISSGTSILLDSMKRFEKNAELQSMACWSLVNIALSPTQKQALIDLGGFEATANAMKRHPHNADVQFRALFGLINLVVPSKHQTNDDTATGNNRNPEPSHRPSLGERRSSGTESLDNFAGEIVHLVVAAMKYFCASETILNRACLVLHNISQTPEYLETLLWTPHCYQMLEWCIQNHPTDQVLRRSAISTLHRLQVMLSSDDRLRARFSDHVQRQQELSLPKNREDCT